MTTLAETTAGYGSLLIHGITTRAAAPAVRAISGARGSIHLLGHGPLAALVEPIDASIPIGNRDDRIAYQRVLDTAASIAPVLPFRFGSVIDDEGLVTDLLATRAAQLTDALASMTGQVQLLVRVRYVQDAEIVLRDIVERNDDVRRLRARTRGLPADAATFERMRLGELVAGELEARRAADRERILPVLTQQVTDWTQRNHNAIDSLLDLAVLLDDARRPQFEQTVDAVARHCSGRACFRLLGPMAPFDFAQVG